MVGFLLCALWHDCQDSQPVPFRFLAGEGARQWAINNNVPDVVKEVDKLDGYLITEDSLFTWERHTGMLRDYEAR